MCQCHYGTVDLENCRVIWGSILKTLPHKVSKAVRLYQDCKNKGCSSLLLHADAAAWDQNQVVQGEKQTFVVPSLLLLKEKNKIHPRRSESPGSLC